MIDTGLAMTMTRAVIASAAKQSIEQQTRSWIASLRSQ